MVRLSHRTQLQQCSLDLRDTVNSVGLIPHWLPFTASNTIVRTFRHAISLDERRAKFKTNLWNIPTPAKPVDEEEGHSRKDKLKAHHGSHDDLDTMIELEKEI